MNKRLMISCSKCGCAECRTGDNPAVYLRIVRQTCVGNEFNKSVPPGLPIQLHSSNHPHVDEGLTTLYVRGNVIALDDEIIRIHDRCALANIKRSVLLYNQHNSNNKDIQLEDCFIEEKA